MILKNKGIISLVHHEFEDLELWYPILRLREEGATVILAGEKAGEKYIGKYGVPAIADVDFKSIKPEEFHGLLVPGGWAPDKLRRFPEVIEIVRHMDLNKKPIAQICHAGWVLISAGILKGKKVTSTPGIKDDMTNAGAEWIDLPVVTDGHLVSSQRPPDLPLYMKEYIKVFS
ncbi:MAG: type 1 glutamine amidotransferase [Cytophagaceae bacterium]|nr:type 1 glutamine amidotransferase [Cytophagaceae bacterium]